jgi:hypothetical protein
MKRAVENPEEELQAAFRRWNSLYECGGHDPTWPDGVGLKFVRSQIFYWKSRIEKMCSPENYPEIYRRPTPPEVPVEYMARADEIRAGAKASLALYLKDSDYRFLVSKVEQLSPKDAKLLCVHNVIGYAIGLEEAIRTDDLVTMRRHEDAGRYLPAFSECARKIRELKPPENEQMNLFYSDGSGSEPEGCDNGDQSMGMKL